MTRLSLEGKVALVTGGARNIGCAIAERLALDGAAVMINSLRSQEAASAAAAGINNAGGVADYCLADVTDPAAVDRLVETTRSRFGRLDILVNNAAVREESPFLALSFEDWRRILAVILDGAFLCAKACTPDLIAAGGGRIVNIGGLGGHVGHQGRPHVVAAKAGLVGLTKALALDLAQHSITVNCVAPGLIGTTAEDGTVRHNGKLPPIGRLGRAEEVAFQVRMLCDPASAYLTGQVIHANGGAYMP
jgi:3-oxoacyl-[acyl-carrier protein] reductase